MEIVHNYRDNDTLRASFCALADDTFGLDFETWYRNGYWKDAYDPHSLLIDGQVVANVSVNRTDMVLNGTTHRLYQLGTVMTAEDCRNRGFIRDIMAQVEKTTAGAEGIYLFANDEVLSFYPKFGFRKAQEFVWSRPVRQQGHCQLELVIMDRRERLKMLEQAVKNSRFPTGFAIQDNPGLLFFYLSGFMQEMVWYWPEQECWAAASLEAGKLTIYQVFGREDLDLNALIAAFGEEVTEVELGFTPADTQGFTCRVLQAEDTTLFVKGPFFQDFEKKRLRFPELSHA